MLPLQNEHRALIVTDDDTRIADLERQLAEAKAAGERQHDYAVAAAGRLLRAEAERDTLRAALHIHGCHVMPCSALATRVEADCNCGLRVALFPTGQTPEPQ